MDRERLAWLLIVSCGQKKDDDGGDDDDLCDNDDGDSDVLRKVGLPPHCFRRADKRSVI